MLAVAIGHAGCLEACALLFCDEFLSNRMSDWGRTGGARVSGERPASRWTGVLLVTSLLGVPGCLGEIVTFLSSASLGRFLGE